MDRTIIGREHEAAILERLMVSAKSEFLALYGRRRVGKTFLIREYFKESFTFFVTGIRSESTHGQLTNFFTALKDYGWRGQEPPTSWRDAFLMMRDLLSEKTGPGKKVVFLDEMPWMDTRRSGFLPALEHFWNSYGDGMKDLLLIACGSASSWMTEKLLRNTGGLHNRVTMRMNIKPFTLNECEQYFGSMGIDMSRKQILEAYMILGGIPFYMSKFDRYLGLAQNIDELFFSETPLLAGEYDVLYRSLFKDADVHIAIIEALSRKHSGLNRNELIATAKIADGGGTTRALRELELCGFIRKYRAYSKKNRESVYQLIDPFTLFYFNHIEGATDIHYWQKYTLSPSHSAWSGYAFELVCLLHLEQIMHKLGADYVLTNTSSWRSEKKKAGTQIDLVIDRADNLIDLCEMKYVTGEFELDESYSEKLATRKTLFRKETGTNKSLRTVMVTTHGVKKNAYSDEANAIVVMNDLFAAI
jgi:predicted AAA+ superfamily ATPase